MFKVITDKNEFIQNPILEMNENEINNSKTDDIVLYGKHYRMYSDEWKHHVHIKCTDYCDADCAFCIERSERNNPQNVNNMLESAAVVLEELANQGHLKTVSITGGEPTVLTKLPDLINLISQYNTTLFSINTNGKDLNKIPSNFVGFVDISKHGINDSHVFKRPFHITSDMVLEFKKSHPNAKVRFQCVLGTNDEMKTVGNVIDFIQEYKDVVDDFSFRNLIIENNEDTINQTLFKFRDILFNNGEFVEQVIQDYYMYETFKMFGTSITLSWSNMAKLKTFNESVNSNFLEEIIVHPDGTVSGSWNKKTLIIHKPAFTENNKFIPCRGVGCENPCKRFLKNETKSEIKKEKVGLSPIKETVDSCHQTLDSCRDYVTYSAVNALDSNKPSVSSCSSFVDSCHSVPGCYD